MDVEGTENIVSSSGNVVSLSKSVRGSLWLVTSTPATFLRRGRSIHSVSLPAISPPDADYLYHPTSTLGWQHAR